ncbi:MAG: glycosyltransferase [Chloroflexia bacterium]
MPLTLYQFIALAVLVALLLIVVVNLLALPRLLNYRLESDKGRRVPLAAILVPARNEEANIGACLRSLLAQDYPNYEVWLYEDDSSDETYRIASEVAAQDPRLRIVRGASPPPPGWLGKANACHRLYEVMRAHSTPDYIFFTDADVRLSPAALSHAVAAAEATGAGLLSIFPQQITISWAERLAVPILLHWAVYTFLPLPLAFSRRKGPAFAAANGQFMLFTRQAYEECGGHTTVRSQILEDVALARAVKSKGYPAILADGGPFVRTRMYDGPAEVWQGYSKNAFAFFGYSPFFLLVGIMVLLALYVAPILFGLYGGLTGRWEILAWAVAQYGAAVLGRLLLAARFHYRVIDTLLHPLAVLFLIAICLNSMWWSLKGKGEWKGRTYTSESR